MWSIQLSKMKTNGRNDLDKSDNPRHIDHHLDRRYD